MYGVYVCWLSCEDEDTWSLDLHAGLQRALDGREDDVMSGDIACDSSDADVLWRTHACCLLLLVLGVRKQRKHSKECEHVRCTAHGRSFARVWYFCLFYNMATAF